jgi:hypothetical protein
MKKLTPLLLFAAVLTAFTSCKKNTVVDESPAFSYIMAVNAAASTANSTIDIAVGAQNMPGIAFGSSSPYTQVPSGDNAVVVDFSSDIANSTINFEKGKAYSVFGVDDASGLRAVAVEDILPGTTTGISNIRFLQFSSDAPAMDIAIGGNVIFSNRSYNDQSTDPSLAGFITIVPGTYDIEVRDPVTSAVLYTFNSVTIGDGKTYNMITKGSVNGINDQGFGIMLVANN